MNWNYVKRTAIASVIVVAVFLALLALTSCAPDSGKVYGKWHYPEDWYVTMQCAGFNAKTGTCSVYMPVTNYIPERWSLGIDNGEDRGEKDVSEAEYNKYNYGDWYGPVPEENNG